MTQARAITTRRPRAAKRKTFFSARLYSDTLRGLRFTGLLLTLASLLITLALLLIREGNARGGMDTNQFGNIPTFFALFSPTVLMMQTFYFLFRRNASDLYHGLPYTRRCLGISLAAASLTWSCATVVLPLALCAVLIPLSPIPFPMALLGWMLAHHLVVILLVTGCALIGASLSGTPLTGILIAGMALFLPRLAITSYRFFFVNVSGMMAYNDASWLLSPALHLPTADLVLLIRQGQMPRFLGMTFTQFFHNAPGILYTLALSAAALAIGLGCFVRRRSELSGQALARPWQRSALHAAIAFILLLGFTYVIYPVNWYRSGFMTDSLLLRDMMVLIAICFTLYLAYIGFRARSWRGVLQAAPLMALSMICVLAVCWGGSVAGIRIRSRQPKADEIVSVRFPSEAGDQDAFFGWQNGLDLIIGQTSDVRYDALEIREFAASAIADRVALLNERVAGIARSVTMELTLTNGETLRRTVDVSIEQCMRLQQILLASPDFMRALRQKPESPRLRLGPANISLPDSAETDALWQAYWAELDALSDYEFVRHTYLQYYLLSRISRGDSNNNEQLLNRIYLYANTWNGMDMCSITYYIGSQTPIALDACVREINRLGQLDYQAALEAAEAMDFAQDDVSYSMQFSYMAQVNGRAQLEYGYLSYLSSWDTVYRNAYYEGVPDREAYEAYRVEEEKQLREILLRATLAEDGQEPLVEANINVTVRRDDGTLDRLTGFAYLKVSDTDYALLQELVLRREQSEII